MRFDWYVTLIHHSLDELCDEILALVKPPKSVRGVNLEERSRKLKEIAQQVVSALYQNYYAINPSEPISYPKSQRRYSSKGGNLDSVPLSYDYCILVFKALIELDWVDITVGVKDKHYTLIRPHKALAGKLDEIGFIWMPQKPIQRRREIELKDVIRDEKGNAVRTKGKTKKIQVLLPKDPIIEEHRKNLQVINDFIVQHCISLDLTDEQLSRVMYKPSEEDDTKDDEADKAINLHSVQLSRIFARGSLNKGGRFYRGFWQNLPSIHRPHIRINGYKTVEVDFGGIGIRILYSFKGLPLEMKDPYDIGLPDWKGSDDERRPIVKEAFNALINDEDGVYKLSKKEWKSLGVNHEAFKELVKKVHPEIADLFQSEKGLQAQYIDSMIAEKVMLSLAKEGILALPIHDSFIVRSGYQQWLGTAMKDAFYEITGQRINLSASIVKDSKHFNLSENKVTEPGKDIANNIINASSLYGNIMNHNNSKMDSYLDTYLSYMVGKTITYKPDRPLKTPH